MLVIRVCIRFCGIGVHSATKRILELCEVLGYTGLAEIPRLRMSHARSMGFRSSDQAGQSIWTSVKFQIGVSDVCTVGTGIVVYQNKFLTNRTCWWPRKLSKNLIEILQCRQYSVFNSVQVSFSVDDNAFPNHDWALAIRPWSATFN